MLFLNIHLVHIYFILSAIPEKKSNKIKTLKAFQIISRKNSMQQNQA